MRSKTRELYALESDPESVKMDPVRRSGQAADQFIWACPGQGRARTGIGKAEEEAKAEEKARAKEKAKAEGKARAKEKAKAKEGVEGQGQGPEQGLGPSGPRMHQLKGDAVNPDDFESSKPPCFMDEIGAKQPDLHQCDLHERQSLLLPPGLFGCGHHLATCYSRQLKGNYKADYRKHGCRGEHGSPAVDRGHREGDTCGALPAGLREQGPGRVWEQYAIHGTVLVDSPDERSLERHAVGALGLPDDVGGHEPVERLQARAHGHLGDGSGDLRAGPFESNEVEHNDADEGSRRLMKNIRDWVYDEVAAGLEDGQLVEVEDLAADVADMVHRAADEWEHMQIFVMEEGLITGVRTLYGRMIMAAGAGDDSGGDSDFAKGEG